MEQPKTEKKEKEKEKDQEKGQEKDREKVLQEVDPQELKRQREEFEAIRDWLFQLIAKLENRPEKLRPLFSLLDRLDYVKDEKRELLDYFEDRRSDLVLIWYATAAAPCMYRGVPLPRVLKEVWERQEDYTVLQPTNDNYAFRIIVFRGSETAWHWKENLWDFFPAPYGQNQRAQSGWLSVVEKLPRIDELVTMCKDYDGTIMLTGHSRGGALAVLTYLYLVEQLGEEEATAKLRCITFAAPPCLLQHPSEPVERNIANFIDDRDVVPYYPVYQPVGHYYLVSEDGFKSVKRMSRVRELLRLRNPISTFKAHSMSEYRPRITKTLDEAQDIYTLIVSYLLKLTDGGDD